MNYTEAKQHYLVLLGKDRATPAPELRLDNFGDFHEWKQEMRAYHAVQIALKIATPEQVQERNAAISVRRGRGRVVRRASYA